MRIAILSGVSDTAVGFMDNSASGALHFYDDKLHTYLKGAAATFSFTASARHPVAEHLSVGNKIAFKYRGRDYYLSIVSTKQDEDEITCEAYSGTLALINTMCPAYSSETAKNMKEYYDLLDTPSILNFKSMPSPLWDTYIAAEFQEQTLLERLFELANVFGAEIELTPKLGTFYNLESIDLDVGLYGYRQIGKIRSEILRYGKGIDRIEKEADISEIVTAVKATGNNGLALTGQNKEVTDDDGNVLFSLKSNEGIIKAVAAAKQFPSCISSRGTDEIYITRPLSVNTDDWNVLYSTALEYLEENCVPKVSYTIKGYIDGDIGDVFTVRDAEFKPELDISVRIEEQEESLSDPSVKTTKLSNWGTYAIEYHE